MRHQSELVLETRKTKLAQRPMKTKIVQL